MLLQRSIHSAGKASATHCDRPSSRHMLSSVTCWETLPPCLTMRDGSKGCSRNTCARAHDTMRANGAGGTLPSGCVVEPLPTARSIRDHESEEESPPLR